VGGLAEGGELALHQLGAAAAGAERWEGAGGGDEGVVRVEPRPMAGQSELSRLGSMLLYIASMMMIEPTPCAAAPVAAASTNLAKFANPLGFQLVVRGALVLESFVWMPISCRICRAIYIVIGVLLKYK
jgi:hypothetical protein